MHPIGTLIPAFFAIGNAFLIFLPVQIVTIPPDCCTSEMVCIVFFEMFPLLSINVPSISNTANLYIDFLLIRYIIMTAKKDLI